MCGNSLPPAWHPRLRRVDAFQSCRAGDALPIADEILVASRTTQLRGQRLDENLCREETQVHVRCEVARFPFALHTSNERRPTFRRCARRVLSSNIADFAQGHGVPSSYTTYAEARESPTRQCLT